MIDDNAAATVAKIEGLFATPLIMADVPNIESLVADLKSVITERRESEPGNMRTNTIERHKLCTCPLITLHFDAD